MEQLQRSNELRYTDENVEIGASIESTALRRKRIASGKIQSRVKFIMQPYHHRVCSNRNLNQVGIKITKPEPPNMLDKSMMTTHQRQPRGNSMSFKNGKMITVASSDMELKCQLVAKKVDRRPKSNYMNTNHISQMMHTSKVSAGKASGFMRFNRQSENLISGSTTQTGANQ